MSFSSLRIKHRLFLGFLGVLLLLLAVSGVALNGLRHGAAQIEVMLSLEGQAAQADKMTALTELNVNRTMALMHASEAAEVAEHFTPLIRQAEERLVALRGELGTATSNTQVRGLLGAVDQTRKAYEDVRKQYFDALRNPPPAPPAPEVAPLASPKPGAEPVPAPVVEPMADPRLPPLERKLDETSEAYITAVGEVAALLRVLVSDEETALHDSIVQTMTAVAILSAAAVLVGMLAAVAITRSVERPLRSAVDFAGVIAKGDLTQTIQSDRRDELGDLLKALGGMQESLRRVVMQIRTSSEHIGMASAEIASGNQDLSNRTEQAAGNLQQTAASMEHVTSTVNQSADAARQANQLAGSAAEVAQRGGQVVSQVVSTMDEINHSSKKISDIIGVIDGIAFQTNILALNAAVEAARAGEQGRGFAVVAGEVRSLAQRSAQAAKEIKDLIGTSVSKVESGSRLVQEAGSTMGEIVSSVQRVSDIIGEITAAAGEQSAGIGQINASITQLDQMTQQNAALVEESAAAAESLRDQAGRLNDAVSVFRTSDAALPVSGAAPRPAPKAVGHAGAAPVRAPAPGSKLPPPKVHPAAQARAIGLAPSRAPAPKAAAKPPAATPAPVKAPPPPPAPAADEGDWESF